MTASTANHLTNPSVSHSGEVDTLLIERFTGQVHAAYEGGEGLMNNFEIQQVVGTNMVSNKYMGDTKVQRLVPGQEPEATTTNFDKNALVVDTMLIARNTIATLHDVQNDFKVSGRLAQNQASKLKELEDRMVIQQLAAGGLTGGTFNGIKVTGGVRRLPSHGAAVKVEVKPSQTFDPYILTSAIEWAINGLIAQKTPISGMKVVMPVNEFSAMCDYGMIDSNGVSQAVEGAYMSGMRGTMKSYGVEVIGSVQFTQMLAEAPNTDDNHHLLSNADNKYRYDVLPTHQAVRAVVFNRDALLCGRTIGLQGDIFYDKRLKTYFVDTWMSEGAIADRYDNMAVITTKDANGADVTATQPEVLVKAKGKARLTKTSLTA